MEVWILYFVRKIGDARLYSGMLRNKDHFAIQDGLMFSNKRLHFSSFHSILE